MYHPCGVEKLQPVVLNGTGFTSKVTVNEDVLEVGGGVLGVGDVVGDVELFWHAANESAAIVVARRRVADRATLFMAAR